MFGDAMIYAAVMISALGLVTRWYPDGERQTKAWTAWVLGQPFGHALMGLLGFLILACGIGAIVWG
jgi:hypothetical protein